MSRISNRRAPHIFSRRSSSPSSRKGLTTRLTSWSSWTETHKDFCWNISSNLLLVILLRLSDVSLWCLINKIKFKSMELRRTLTWTRRYETEYLCWTSSPSERVYLLGICPPRTTGSRCAGRPVCEQGRRGTETRRLERQQDLFTRPNINTLNTLQALMVGKRAQRTV